ncbi:MAG: flagellar basal body-associated FliL family protein [Caulobacterales bacterium]|uniref:flagellar basal body-associated FliL family protein n=1 Tax=Glycocaulis sp. TaxID=1969725 RepID=UPI003F9F18E8
MASKDDEIDEAAEGENAEGEGKSKPDIKKLALFIGLPAIIVILALVAGALFLFGGGGGEEELAEADGEHAEAGEHHEAEAAHAIHSYEIEEPLVVQITGSGNVRPILTLKVSFEYTDPAVEPALQEGMQRILDQYQGFLRELTPDDLAGSAGQHRLRLELLRRTNLAIAPAQIDRVLLTEILITQT